MSAVATKKPKLGLRALVEVISAKLDALDGKITSDHTRPLTARQLCERWNIAGGSDKRKLINLGRLCDRRSLNALPGQDGWNATYALVDVLRAEGRRS